VGEFLLLALKHTVQIIAQGAPIQYARFPSFAHCADEMVIDFDQSYTQAKADSANAWSAEQSQALAALDAAIAEVSGDRPEIWLDKGCLYHPAWTVFRHKARAVLAAFGWENEDPPENDAIYVTSPASQITHERIQPAGMIGRSGP
jgi:hypothetical protein